MSKSAKNKKALERKKMKSAKKAMNAAKYAAWRDAGTNSKRGKIRAKRAKKQTIRMKRHLVACGNAGCSKCRPSKE